MNMTRIIIKFRKSKRETTIIIVIRNPIRNPRGLGEINGVAMVKWNWFIVDKRTVVVVVEMIVEIELRMRRRLRRLMLVVMVEMVGMWGRWRIVDDSMDRRVMV